MLDDGDRPWVAALCAAAGARYVRRSEHTHAKAGNMNHALELMVREVDAGAEPVDVVAVLDRDHVPLPRFLSATLGWFDDPEIALVQAPQTSYSSGAFDDDGDIGNAYRSAVQAAVTVGDVDGELVDISDGGAAVRLPSGTLPAAAELEVTLPGATPVVLQTVRVAAELIGASRRTPTLHRRHG